jgi:Putative Flp pilus-assembly TadE/G-like
MTTKPSGQVLPIVAMLMVCFVGMAALAIDGSNALSQQRRMQADLDMAVTFAAGELLQPITTTAQSDAVNLLVQRGYTNTNTQTIAITVPPQTAPYNQADCPSPLPHPCYVEGFLTQNVRSFFAGVLGLKSMKISVHAVAETGGDTWQPPTLLALDPNTGDCGFAAQGANGVSGILDASVHSNSQTCVKNGNIYATGDVFSDVKTTSPTNPITSTSNVTSGNGTGTFMPNPYNPAWPVTTTVPSAPTSDTCSNKVTSWDSSSNGCDFCNKSYFVANGDTYYQPADSTGAALMSNGLHASNGTNDFLPYCDSSGNPTFGIYLFQGDLQLSSTSTKNAPVINVYDSTFVFDYSVKPSGAKIDVTGGSLNMQGPVTSTSPLPNSTSPFYGSFGSIVIWQVNTPVPCNTPVSSSLAGNATGAITGIVDLQCTNITVQGNSANESWITGGLVAWEITVAGSGSGIVTRDISVTPALPRGSVLVQ